MHFPPWADGPNLTQKMRARQRLRYIVSMIALHVCERATHRALADVVGINHSTISKAIRDGGFSHYTAALIETSIGRQHVRAEWLVDPLSINTK